MKNILKLILIIAYILVTVNAQAQDIIVKNDSDTIFCKILDVNDENIQYRIQNENMKTTNTVNLKYISYYQINQDNSNQDTTIEIKKKESAFRITAGGGYAHGIGKVAKTGDLNLNRMSEDMINGYNWEANVEYYFNLKRKDALNFGIALNLNNITHKAEGSNVNIPDFGHADHYKETQTTVYVGPAFAMRYDEKNWLFTLSAGYGAVFFSDQMSADYAKIKGTSTTVGSNASIGADYKISPNWGIGLKLSVAGGAINSMNFGGTNVKLDEKVSASSWLVSAILSFRTK
jgi:hypothetical protein